MRRRPGLGAAGPLLAAFVLAGVVFAGCVDSGSSGPPSGLRSLMVYEYRYGGDDGMHPDHTYGWMARVTNVAQERVFVTVDVKDNHTEWGPVYAEGWADDGGSPQGLDPGESMVYLFQRAPAAFTPSIAYVVNVVEDGPDGRVLEEKTFVRSLREVTVDAPVEANDHVLTRTVGVWTNGTSFYTNIRDLNDDPGFPAGYDRMEFGGDDLRVYVYDADSSEQPEGSRDRCFFVTIPGYNDLLKTQGEGTSNIRFLRPEEAYTRDGAEEHFLYGEALVFLNTLVSNVGEVTPTQGAPQPSGDCFNPLRYLPVDPPLHSVSSPSSVSG